MYSLIKRGLRALSLPSFQKGILLSYFPILFLLVGVGMQLGGTYSTSIRLSDSPFAYLQNGEEQVQANALACDPPSGLGLEIENIFIVKATWNVVSGALTYNIRYRSVGSSTWTTINGLPKTEHLLAVNSTDSYEWEVQAVCDGEVSDWVSGPVFDSSCDSPNALAVGSVSTATADVSWAAEPTAQDYELRYRVVGTSAWTNLSVGNSLSITLQNLTAGNTYEWQVLANCGNGNSSSWGAGPNFQTTGVTCNPPGSPSVGGLTGTSADISWGAVTGAQGYELRYRRLGTSTWTIIQVSGNSVTLQNLETGVDYEWEVRTDCGTSVSSWISGSDFQTTCPGPDGLSVNNITETSATVDWNAVTGALNYTVRYRVLASSSWTSQTVNTTTFDITGLTESTDYEWQVQSNCVNGSSDWIRGPNFETLGAPCETPSNLAVANVTPSSATFSWTAVPTVQTYEVRYRVRGSSAWTTQAVTGTTLQVADLDTFTNYEWQVRTICANSESVWLAGPFFQTQGPTCEAPSELAVSNITLSSASFSWTAVAGVTGYEIRYRIVGGGAWTVLPAANTSITINGLDFSTAYEWQVRSVCAQSSSQWIAGSNFETLGPACDPPSTLGIANVTESAVTVSWTPASGEQTYEVRYRVTASATWTVQEVTGSSLAISGLSPATNYEWQVRTKCPFSNSAWIPGPFFTTQATPCPDPTGLSTGAITTTTAVLNWDVAATATGYKVRYRVKGTTAWTTIDAPQNTSTLSGLSENTLYEWQVQTDCQDASSNWVSGTDFQTGLTPCLAPTGLSVGTITDNGAQFTWSAVAGASGYGFRYRVLGTTTWTILEASANGLTLEDLSSETTYEWQVRTDCGDTASDWVSGTNFQTLMTPCIPPTGLTVSELTNVSATLSWTVVAGATDYDLRYRVQGTTAWIDLDIAAGTTSLTELTPNTTYEWQVRSNCTANQSDWVSGPDFQTLETPCPLPVNLAVSSLSSTSAGLTWDPVAEATYYDIRYRVVGETVWNEDSTLGTSFTLTELTPESSYEWQVRTVCSENASEWASGPNFQTPIVCPPPVNLSVQDIMSLTAEIIWDSPTTIEGVTFSYNIRYRILGTEDWTLETKEVNSTILSKLDPETDYEWQVQTDCGGGNTSVWVEGPNFKTLVAPCENPSGLRVFDVSQDSATFSWNGIPNAVEYQLRYREAGTDLWVIITSEDTFLIVMNLLAGATYNWEIRANCGDSSSEWVPGEDFTTDQIPCDPPSMLMVDSVTNTMAWVNWVGYVDATLYRVRYRVNGTEVWTTVETPDLFAIFENLDANTEYQWAAQSQCGSIPTEWVLGPNFTTLENPNPCDPPQNLQVLDTTEFTTTLSWSREMGVDSFRVRYRIVGTTQWQIAISTDTVFTLENLTDGVEYQWEVQSICGELFSSWSMGENFSTVDIPTVCVPPTDLAIVELGTSSVLVSWRVGLQVSTYEVRYKAADSTAWDTLNTPIGLATLEELNSFETYQWEVRSLCQGDTSDWIMGPEFTTQSEPLVSLLQPEDSTFLEVGDSVLIEAFALDLDGDSLSISLFANDSLIAQGDTNLLTYLWEDLPQGLYRIYAEVTDSDGNTGISEVSRIFVGFDVDNFLVGDFIVFGNELCFLDSAQIIFGDASIGALEYEWKFGEGAFPATADSAGPHVVKYASSGTKTIELTVRDSLGNENVRIKNLTVFIKPELSSAGDDQVLCGDQDSTVLSAELPEMGQGSWSLISGIGEIVSPDSSQTLVKDLGSGENIFFWEVSNGFCSSDPDTLIVVRGSCVPNLTGEIFGVDTVCFTDIGTVFSVEDDSLIDEYIWTLPEGFEGEIDRNVLTLTQISGAGGLITVFGRNEFGESSTLGRDVIVDACDGRFQLITFTAYQDDTGDILVDWVTQYDQGIATYAIERSLDSLAFTEVRTLSPTRDQEIRHRYIEPDEFAYGGVVYYRIRIESAEGQIIYSEIVKLNLAGLEPLLSAVISPNPLVDEKLTLRVGVIRSGLLLVETYDRIGRKVFSALEPVDAGLNELSFDVSQIAEGVYILKVQKAVNGKEEVIKFLK
ncbi:MAG: fibronectin type III domain-containing protein [Bacteroidota bacterium]